MSDLIQIRAAEKEDVPLILRFIRDLAAYEKLSASCVATEELIHDSLFGPKPCAEAILAYYNDEPAGFAIFFHNFSTFLGRRGLYLEDLFVTPHLRGKGIGKAMLTLLARLAKERGCGRFEWAVLDWNTPSIEFYKRLGAVPLDDWTVFRITGAALDNLAGQSKGNSVKK